MTDNSFYKKLRKSLPPIFSKNALKLLPQTPNRINNKDKDKYELITTNDGRQVHVKIPKVVKSQSKVEPKVYLANERTWVSYMNMGVLLATLSLTLYNSASDKTGEYFGVSYAFISIATILYGSYIYQVRLKMINSRSNEHFDQLIGPVLICISLFLCVAYNFYQRG